jgi:hypothetical protein
MGCNARKTNSKQQQTGFRISEELPILALKVFHNRSRGNKIWYFKEGKNLYPLHPPYT